jgi:hypothetical protein
MIPQKFRRKQEEKVAVPSDVRRLFKLYEESKMQEADLICLLRGEMDLHREFPIAVNMRILGVIDKLKRDIEAREMCKQETGMAAVPARSKKIEW